MINNSPGVAIFDAQAPTALAFTRSLGALGIAVHLYGHDPFSASRLSRFCTSFTRCPDPTQTDEFLPWLQQEMRRGHAEFVAPTSDLMAFYMAEYPECFPKKQMLGMASPKQIITTLFKDRFDKAVARAKFKTPWTLYPHSIEEAHATANDLPYPVIIKPKTHVASDWARGKVVHNKEELQQYYAPYVAPPHKKAIFAKYPDMQWPMLQEYIPGALQHLFSISGLLAADGTVIAYSGAHKTRQWPPALGVGTIFEPWRDTTQIQKGLQLVQKLLSQGIFELEFIFDERTKEYLAIDLNPRAHGHIAFDSARGHDLPALWHRLASGKILTALPQANDKVHWLHSIPFHCDQLVGLVRGPHREKKVRQYLQILRQPHVDIIHQNSDPLPTLLHAATMFKHPGSLIRPFWQQG
jgi:D-aspartate ligase